jgi:hypothetical protein
VFQDTTLRGLLLEAYAFWQMGQIALIGAIVSFVMAAVMLVMTGFGFCHLRRVDPAAKLMPQRRPLLLPPRRWPAAPGEEAPEEGFASPVGLRELRTPPRKT